MEFGASLIKLALFEKHAALGNNGFSRVDRHLLNEGLGGRYLLKLILDANLELQYFIFEVPVFNLLKYLECVLVHSSLVESLSMVQLVGVPSITVAEELRKLVIAVGCPQVILHLEVAVS